LIDYIFRFLGAKFLSPDQHAAVGLALPDRQTSDVERALTAAVNAALPSTEVGMVESLGFSPQSDAPSCADCGAIMIRNGSCYKCLNCGATSGCS